MDFIVKPKTVQAQVVETLREAILVGHFKPGERLVEAKLCAMTNVSRTSIREALRHLQAEKLITFIPNRGPLVAEITWKGAAEIYHVRGLLEGEAAALFAVRATDAEKEEMRAALADFREAYLGEDALGRLRATGRFYDVMLRGCGNRVIDELLKGLLARINFLRARSMSQPGRSKHSLKELERILQAVDANDPEEAREAATDHIEAASAAARNMVDAKTDAEPAG